MRLLVIITWLGLLAAATHVQAQSSCTAIGQTPSSAFPVCGNTTFTQTTVGLCGNTNMLVPCNDNALFQDKNPYWYKFTCFVAGTLAFEIKPFTNSDDYDWQLFDVTGQSPNAVFTNSSLFVACNWSGDPGPTGASAAGNTLIGCAGSGVFPFSKMPNLIVGHDYLLLVSHFTNTQSGYTLSFSGGTASISDPLQPALVSARASCDATQVTIIVNKKLKCNSLTSSGSEFSMSPAVPIGSVTGLYCSGGFDFDSIQLNFNTPLAPGNYTTTIGAGSDGNTLLDICGTPVPVGDNVSFTIPPRIPIPMGTAVGPSPCTPTLVQVNFPNKIRCSSIASDGSDFLITGPAGVTITGASAVCDANGQTSSITIQASAPIVAPGNYQVTTATGNDGNVLFGTCNEVVQAGLSSGFSVVAQGPVAMGTANNTECAPASLTLGFAEPILCSSIAADGSDFAISGPSAVTITGATATCDGSGETTAIVLQLATPIATDGQYQVTSQVGTDGNVLIGECSRQLMPGLSSSFDVPVVSPAIITDIDPPGCSPTVITLHLDKPVTCASIAPDGTDFFITGPDLVIISGAGATCASGSTTSIQLQLSASIVKGGNYQLHLQSGSDGNTLLSECLRPSLVSITNFQAADTVSAHFTYITQQLSCVTNHVEFTNNGGASITNWSWTVNNSAVGTNQPLFVTDFPATSQQNVALSVSNGICSATYQDQLVFNDRVIAKFSADSEICPEDSLKVTNLSTGPVSIWQWSFGDGQTSSAQNPPPIHYPVTLQESNYVISLTATSANGCSDRKVANVKVLSNCLIAVPSAFTPNNDGVNDYFFPIHAFKATNLDFKVYNRWGQLVFQTTDWRKKWDGTFKGVPQASDMFVWTLQYTDSRNGQPFSLKGTVMLIR